MLINKIIINYNGSSQKKFNVKIFIYILLIIYFYINSFVNDKEWLYIVQKYQENSIHTDRTNFCFDLIVKLYNCLKPKRTSVISNSLIFYHKYYIYNLFTNSNIINKLNENNLNNIDLECISIACFFISLKASNFLIQIEFLLEIIDKNKILENKIINDKFEVKNLIFKYESDILFTINFELENELPYIYIKNIWGDLSNKIIESINNNNKNLNNNILNKGDQNSLIKNIRENLVEFINFSFLFPFFLYYNPSVIAFSCLIFVLNKFNLKINIIDIISDHKEMGNISIDDIEVCSSLIDEVIISKNKKTNNGTQKNNINNINIQNFISINHNIEPNNELKWKLSDNAIKDEMFLSKSQK